MALIPKEYSSSLHAPLLEIANTTMELKAVRATLAHWEQHQAAGTHPSNISTEPPRVPTADPSSALHLQHQEEIEQLHTAHLDNLLNLAIQMKRNEALFLEASLTPSAYWKVLQPVIEACTHAILHGTRDSTAVEALSHQVLADCVIYAWCVRSIVEASDIRE